MQSIEARSLYKNSFQCAAKIFKEEGILTFWSGAVPRLGRLILSGGIVFTMYVPAFPPSHANTYFGPGMRNLWSLWTSLILMGATYKIVMICHAGGADSPCGLLCPFG
jgi:hypothetical protein